MADLGDICMSIVAVAAWKRSRSEKTFRAVFQKNVSLLN